MGSFGGTSKTLYKSPFLMFAPFGQKYKDIFTHHYISHLEFKKPHNIVIKPVFAPFGQVLCHLDGKPSGAPLSGSRGHCIGVAFEPRSHRRLI